MMKATKDDNGEQKEPAYRKKRYAVIGLSVMMLAAIIIGIGLTNGSFSYFHAKDQVTNEFDMSQLDFVIEEPHWENPVTPVKPGDVLEKDPSIRNIGQIDFVTRVRIEEVWTLKNPTDETPELPLKMTNEDYVRYYSSSTYDFTAQSLLEKLQADKVLPEASKSFSLVANLNAEASGWFRGSSANSPWFYYHQILKPNEVSNPIFRAVTIRTAEDYIPQGVMTDAEYKAACIAYNAKLAKYNLDVIVYAEAVQAEQWAWNDLWGADGANDLPIGWNTQAWGKNP